MRFQALVEGLIDDPALRRAIAGFYRTRYGVNVAAERIIVTPGASGSVLLCASIPLLLHLKLRHDRVELVEPCLPQPAVRLDPRRRVIETTCAEPAVPDPADLLRCDEAGGALANVLGRHQLASGEHDRLGQIAGAALDVFENEPNPNKVFLNLDNVLLTPHIGSATTETRIAMTNLAVDNLEAFFAKQPLLSEVHH